MNNRFTTVMLMGFLWLGFTISVSTASAACNDSSYEQQCKQGHENANFNCDEKNNADVQNVSGLAGLTSASMGQSGAESAQASCGQTNDLSNKASGALQSYKAQCQQGIATCKQSCQKWVDYVNQNPDCGPKRQKAKEQLQKCDSDYQPKVQQADQGINNYNAAQSQATDCKNETNGEGKMPEMPKFPEPKEGEEKAKEKEKEKTYCEENPDFAGCSPQAVVDCADPAQATTNKTCVCAKNPKDPMCGLDAGNVAAPSIGVTDGTNSSQEEKATERATELPGRTVRSNSASETSSSSGSGSSGGSSVGSSGGSTGGSSSSAQSASKQKDAETNGSSSASASSAGGGDSGGGGGGGGWGAFSGSSSDDESASGGVRSSRATASATNKSDLRNYLPGGANDPSRIAGKSDDKQRADGITGPHSDQWRKIRYRYQVISPSLMDQP